jgi:DNA invertase Pin-like site-specific DNA recombinase
MIYGYARVSTSGQALYGYGLDVQIELLKKAGVDKIYADNFTGMSVHRPKLEELLSLLKEGDTLIVPKLDRIARSASKGAELIQELLDKGVIVHILNMGIMDNSPTGKLVRQVLFAFAEFERDMIVERTSEGKRIAKMNPDFKEGRPKKEIPDFQKFLQKQKDGNITVLEACKQLHISKSQWYNLARSY